MESHKFVIDVNGQKKIVGDCTSVEACNAVRRLMSVGYCSECAQVKEVAQYFNWDSHTYQNYCNECK
jgi:hypothetical protein